VTGGDHHQLAHVNLVEAFALLPQYQSGGFVRRCGSVMVAATGSPIAFFNEVLPVADDVDADELAEAVEVADAAGLSWMAHLRDGMDDRLAELLQRNGLEEVEDDYPAMMLSAMPACISVPSGVEVRRVSDATGFDIHLRTAAAMAGTDPDLVRTWLAPGVIDDLAAALFIGYLDGEPVATSMSVRTGDVVGVYNVGTAEPARRRGIGWAMTAAAILAGAEAGATLATLQSSPMAARMYEAHGFQRLFQYRLFHRPS
jgi:ribosomal protein S18 acetylase RimI-like enzyme